MPLIPIGDPGDPRLADYRNIPDPELVSRGGIFIAEGRLVVSRLLASDRFAARSLLLTPTAREALADDPAFDRAVRGPLPIYLVSPELMRPITGFNLHRGCLAIGERPAPASWTALAATARRLMIAERVANPDNVGALFRNAAAFGADAVLLEERCTDPLYRKAIRTSMGAALRVPFARIEPWPAALDTLRGDGWSLVALSPAADRTLADIAPAVRDARVALVLGHEGDGLTAEAMARCDRPARIPIAPEVDSLNVATAAAIALYELQR